MWIGERRILPDLRVTLSVFGQDPEDEPEAGSLFVGFEAFILESP